MKNDQDPKRTFFSKRSEDLVTILENMANEINERTKSGETLTYDEQIKLAEKTLELLGTKKLFVAKDDLYLNEKLKKILEKDYDIQFLPPININTPFPRSSKKCSVCGKLLGHHSTNVLKKYCSSKCRSICRKRARDAKLGIDREIEHHDTCMNCNKPLTKRLGAKTCSPSCRKQLSLRKKVNGSLS